MGEACLAAKSVVDVLTVNVSSNIIGYFANLETDPNTLILGLEPIYACECSQRSFVCTYNGLGGVKCTPDVYSTPFRSLACHTLPSCSRNAHTDGIAVLGCVALGWLSGPILGNALWRATHRSVLESVERMDSVFLRHIQRMRVDPSRQSVNNPVSSASVFVVDASSSPTSNQARCGLN